MNALASSTPTLAHVALTRAMGLLRGAQARYAILLPDGQVFGDLPIAPDKPAKSKRRIVNHWATDLQYMDTMKAMQPGTEHRWQVPHSARSLHGSISGYATRLWGKDNFICVVEGENRDTVALLRVV